MFATFNISELREESENDYALEFTTSDSMMGIQLTEDEMKSVGQAMIETAEGGLDAMNEGHVEELVE